MYPSLNHIRKNPLLERGVIYDGRGEGGGQVEKKVGDLGDRQICICQHSKIYY